MSTPKILTGLAEIAERYDAILCDVWGVLHNGEVSFAEAASALRRFQQTRGPVVLISNSPRPFEGVVAQLELLGVPKSAWSDIVTSGDVTRTLLAARAPGPAWAIGPERDEPLYHGLGLDFAGPNDAAFISCTGPTNDEVETPEDYRERLVLAAQRGLAMICANPDIVVQRGPKLIYCGGALAALYAGLGGDVIMAGKPHSPIYQATLEAAERQVGRVLDRKRILCIGDGIPTDVLGANRQGLDCLFVADGIHAAEASGDHGRLDAQRLSERLSKDGVHAAYALAALVW